MKGSFRGAKPLFPKTSPSPLKERGTKGVKYDWHKKIREIIEEGEEGPTVDFRDLEKTRKLARKKIRLDVALQRADTWLLVGISFGATFPELTEKMWGQEYEQDYRKQDPEAWAMAKKFGLDIPEEFTPLPLGEMEQLVLAEVTSYVTEYFPELVDPLSLHLR